MFPPLGLFKDIACPQGQQCSLLACMFSHKSTTPASVDQAPTQDVQVLQEDGTAPGPSGPKKIKLHTETEDSTQNLRPSALPKSQPQNQNASQTGVADKKPQPRGQNTTQLQSISRKVSPPPPRKESIVKKRDPAVSEKSEPRLPPRRAPRESLNPRMLPKAPASHGVRLSILTRLHAAMCALNEKVAKEKGGKENYLVLSPNELVTMALDEEEKAAKDNPAIYANVIKLRIVRLSKMSKEDWEKDVKSHLNERYYKIDPSQQEQKPKALETGLSLKEEIAVARKLVTPLEGLEQYGYVTKAPTKEEVESARKGVTESKGWEKCDRCGGRFQVFPGRREDGSLTTGGQCRHHPGKPFYPPKKQTDHITGSREAYFSCCNETIGTSSGCTTGNTHVFKVSETKRLASVLQFEETPTQPDKGPQQPISFDCEMGYTTLGLELIRLTAVSWPKGEELLDVLVRPMGEILDLNSRFSGVFPEHYTKAVPYGSSIPNTSASALDHGEIEPQPLQVVESPAAARALLFQLLQPDTPLIGHAIDNDLNSCRIIHPTIIDTVLLYPHPRGLPIRMGLKVLSKKYLDRDIQTGGNQGHDSKEDAVATGDLVRVKASETWKILKSKGWIIQDDKLIPPPGTADTAVDWRLGPGAGHKRKDSALEG